MLKSAPAFPQFKSISLTDEKEYSLFYREFDPYSDFSFNNLWIWFNQKGQLALSQHNENLIIKLTNPFENNATEITLLGRHECSQTVARLLRWEKAMGLPPQLVMVPQVVVDNLGRAVRNFNVIEDLDNRDYLYDVRATYDALGGKYVRYRHALSYFDSHYLSSSVKTIDLSDISQCILLINRLHTWDTTYRQGKQALLEGLAIDRYLRLARDLPVQCLGLFIEDTLEAFALYQLQGDYAIVNHLKCNNAFNYIFDVTFSRLIRLFKDLGVSYVNLEQDLGLPGLRTHKERLRPSRYLQRYTIRP